ncbi:hypothetical protein [Qipengyuania citrea]|uniref:hypothetical protein n=1 Tax=Qipengyuania citrea TaxID=225971 RepID=UPI003298872A
MPVATYQAWLSLYAGVGLVVVICAAAAICKTAVDYRTGVLSLPFGTWQDRVLAAPKLWWRWQVNYLTGAPVVLMIALLYAHHIGFAVLGDV